MPRPYKKKLKRMTLEDCIDIGKCSIIDLVSTLQSHLDNKELYNIRFVINYISDNYDGAEYDLMCDRLETDEEFEKRIKKARQYKIDKKASEIEYRKNRLIDLRKEIVELEKENS